MNHNPITFLWFGGKPLPLNRDKEERAEVPHWIWNPVPDLGLGRFDAQYLHLDFGKGVGRQKGRKEANGLQ